MAEKYSFIVVRYPNRETAAAALEVAKGLAKEKVVKLKDAVALTKDDKGKLHMQQTKDDPASRGFLKGGVIGIIFAVLFGPAGWIVAGAALGTAFAMFDRGIKNKLLKELGEKMTPDQSALAVLVEEADWAAVKERMGAQTEAFGDIDFAGVARAMGAHGATITDLEQVPDELGTALARPRPTLLDVKSSIAKSPIYSLPVRAGIYG